MIENKSNVKVKVIDMPIGIENNNIISYIKNNPDKKYIVVTDTCDALELIQNNLKDMNFSGLPDKNRNKALEELLSNNRNVVIDSIALFLMNEACKELVKNNHYTMVSNNCISLVLNSDIKKTHIQEFLIPNKLLIIGKNNTVKYDEELSKKKFLKKCPALSLYLINIGESYLVDKSNIVSFTRKETIESFDEVIFISFLFDGSMTRYYLDFMKIEYEYYCIEDNKLVKGIYDYSDLKSSIGDKLNIYDGKMNKVANSNNALSMQWYANSQLTSEHDTVRKNIYNYKRNISKSTTKDFLWTVHDIPHKNTPHFYNPEISVKKTTYRRSTNKCIIPEIDRKSLAYCTNVYVNSFHYRLFRKNGVKIDEDEFSTSMMMNWVVNSCVSNSETVNIYIPSKRMRDLLCTWCRIPLLKVDRPLTKKKK